MSDLTGRRVRLIRCTDEHTHLEPGALGTVLQPDDTGTLHVAWDSGHRLGLIPDVDAWEVLPVDPNATIAAAELAPVPPFAPSIPSGRNTVRATFSDGRRADLFEYYVDELTFTPGEFTGLTEQQARDLFFERDMAYVRS